MGAPDIADTIAAFARAAGAAKRLGFDAIELHGAHGYLIDQFFWEGTNLRQDGYGGGTLVQRGRFAADILKAVRAEVGPDYPVIIRLSQWKQQDYAVQMARTPQEMEAWLQPLADAGADIFHCSQRRFWEPEYAGSDLNFAGWAKKLTGKPTITVGSVGPYVGLFGTVWGIMNAFRGLANMAQATLAHVAPGIAEALIATAIGLFAAIPAVIAYNRFSSSVDRLAVRYESFIEEFTNILQRKS